MRAPKKPMARWERAAARRNAREAQEAPLLAYGGLLHQHTAQEVKDSSERLVALHQKQMADCDAELTLRANDYKARLLSVVGPAELARKEEAWLRIGAPQTPAYLADNWYQELLEACRAAVAARVGAEAFARLDAEQKARPATQWVVENACAWWWRKLAELGGAAPSSSGAGGSCP